MIVLFDPATDRLLRFFQTAVLVEPDLFLLQAAMEALDHAVAFGMVERGAAVRDAEPRERIEEARGRELRAVIGVEREPVVTRAIRHLLQHGTLDSDHIGLEPDCPS